MLYMQILIYQKKLQMKSCPNFQHSTVILPTPGAHTFPEYYGGGLLI